MIWHRSKDRGHYLAKLCVQQKAYIDKKFGCNVDAIKTDTEVI